MNEDLVEAARAGDRQALNGLLHELLPVIRRRVHRYIRPPEADDVTQQVLIEVAKSIARFRGESNVRTWVSRIAVRVTFRHLKRRNKVLPFKADVEPHDNSSHARRMDARDRLRTLERCLDKLSPERRMVFLMQDVDGYTAPEVAEMLDIPLGTVYGRLRDARRIVRDALDREEAVPGAAEGGSL